jgi:hypothetical protein
MQDQDMLRACKAFAENGAAIVEEAIVQSQRVNRERAAKELRSIVYGQGDLVLMHIPRTKKGTTTRLRYQTIGPFEVLPHLHLSRANADGSFNTYRLRHLASGQETTANVRQILPYISRAAHDHLQPPTHLPASVTPPAKFDPQPGSFVLLPNEGGVPYHLLQVLSRDGEDVVAQYLNTTQKKRLSGFRLCWQYTGAGTQPEIQSNAQPTKKNYTAWNDNFVIAEFCQREVNPEKIGTKAVTSFFTLKKTDVSETLKHPPL